MSAELLRRAAEKLREGALALPATMVGHWRTRAGGVVADDGTDVGMLVVEPYNPTDDPPLMAFIALLDPPVALALAVVLENLAAAVEGTVGDAAAESIFDPEFALARAILREDS